MRRGSSRHRRDTHLAHPGNVDLSITLGIHWTSLLLAQLSENGELARVFSELLDGTGVEITMRPIERYLPAAHMGDTVVAWRDLVRSATRLGESAIGTLSPGSGEGLGGVVVNPAKSKDVRVHSGVQLIVIA